MEKLAHIAGSSAIAAVPVVILAGMTLALFFRGAGDWLGPANDLLSALALLLLIAPVLALNALYLRYAGGWLPFLTLAALAGILVAALGQVLLVAGAISLGTSFITGGLGVVPLLLWAIAILVLGFQHQALPVYLSWLLLGVLALTAALTIASMLGYPAATWLLAVLLLLVMCAWLGSLGKELLHLSAQAGGL